MDIQQYTRKPFFVTAVQVTLQNIEEVAEWCNGTIEYVSTRMLGTETPLPVVKIQGQGENRGKEFTAALGSYVVELKGSFRVYKSAQFDASFELKEEVAVPSILNFEENERVKVIPFDEVGTVTVVGVVGDDGYEKVEVQLPFGEKQLFDPGQLLKI